MSFPRYTLSHFTEEFIAHGDPVSCVRFGRKSGGVFATGGEDKKVNVWAIGKPNTVIVTYISVVSRGLEFLGQFIVGGGA